MRKLTLLTLLVLTVNYVLGQNWLGSTIPTTTTDFNTQIQLTHIGWGSHHGILFNAKKRAILNDGNLFDNGNLQQAFEAGPHGSGAGGIFFLGNGGRMDFVVSGASNGVDQPIGSEAIKMTLNRSGNVGIGTTNPDAKLAVKGTIHAEEVKLDLQVPGPDYVFEPTYQLPTLTEIENYIKANKHLPEVPSAKEMETNGINLSEMNMLLLKKVEELTLHIIEQGKVIDKLQTEHTNAETSAKKVEELMLLMVNQQRQIELLSKKIDKDQ